MSNITDHEWRNRTDCETAYKVLNPSTKGILYGECIVALLAICPNLLLLSAVWHVTVFPSNLRLLVGHFAFVLIYFSTASIIRAVYFLTTRPCAFGFTARMCRIFELTTMNLVVSNIYLALVSLCLERLYAAVMYQKYDNNKKPWLAIVLIVGTWTGPFIAYGRDVFTLSDSKYLPFCDSTFLPLVSGSLTPIFMGFEWSSALLTMFLFFYNRHVAKNMAINRAVYDLSSRFQIDQNVQVDKIVFPWVLLHLLCHLPALTLLLLVTVENGLSMTTEQKAWLKRLTFLWRLIYALFDPILAFAFNTHLKQHLAKGLVGRAMKKMGIGFGTKNRMSKIMARSEGVAHFNQLAKVWAMPTTTTLGKGTTVVVVVKTAKF